MSDMKIEKKLKNLENNIKEIWTILKERDNYLFGKVSKSLTKIEKEVKALKKKR